MSLSKVELEELQNKYHHLINYDDEEDPFSPIDPLTYVDSNGDMLIHIAAQNNDSRTILLLLKAGFDINQPGDMGCTALHYATSEEVKQLLLDHGASSDIRDEFGRLAADSQSSD